MTYQPGIYSPDPRNLLIGKGACLLDPGTGLYHMGNVPSVKITPKSDPLDHYTSLQRLLVRDLRVVVKQDVEIKLELEEMNVQNLATVFSGAVTGGTAVGAQIAMMTATQITGHFQFFATNDIGPRWNIDIPSIMFLASGTYDAISEKFANVELTGSLNSINGAWGTFTLAAPVDTIAPTNILAPFIIGASPPVHASTLLTVNIGGWTGASSYTYQWEWFDTSANIVGATSYTYTPVTGDETHTLACKVTATNGSGSTTVITAATLAVT